MSPAKDLGSKYVCWKCETKFYDLHKPVPVCPKCGADQRDAPVVKPSRGASRASPRPKAKEVVAPPPVEEEDALPDDDEDEAEAEEAEEEP